MWQSEAVSFNRRASLIIDPDGGDGVLQEMPKEFTSWEAIHAALCAAVPDEFYRSGSEVVTVSQTRLPPRTGARR